MSEGATPDIVEFDEASDAQLLDLPHPRTGQPQVAPVEDLDHPPVSDEDRQRGLELIRKAEEEWEKERSWPLWEVKLEGDEVEYVARAGVNVAQEETEYNGTTYRVGQPLPYRDTARCSVTCFAPTEDAAKAKAMAANPGYHTVASVKEKKKG